MKLGNDQGKVIEDAKKWLVPLQEQVAILKTFQGRKEAKW